MKSFLPRRTLFRAVVALSLLAGKAGVVPAQPPSASPASPSAPSPNLAGIAHVALRVHDLAASIAFYEKLGFVKAFELSRDGQVYEAFIKVDDRQFLELYPATPQNSQLGFLHLCFEGSDLASVHDFYLSEGLQPTPVKTAGAGNLLFTMHGPPTPTGDQNMEYTQYMPGSLHSKDIGQHLGAERIATHLASVTIAASDPAAARTFYLGKIGFTAGPGQTLTLPGTRGDSLTIVPAQSLGFRARFTLQVDNMAKAKSLLKQRSLASTATKNALTLTDPDGNQILLAPPA